VEIETMDHVSKSVRWAIEPLSWENCDVSLFGSLWVVIAGTLSLMALLVIG
jgi:hypothetical protein